ncbi:hypothetical protein MTBLM5_410015 [Magnetospirillum sp. LM-5]|nr:hypothetical protein MTBLM5_410015 [Magnetospirillum sp. LM-5]
MPGEPCIMAWLMKQTHGGSHGDVLEADRDCDDTWRHQRHSGASVFRLTGRPFTSLRMGVGCVRYSLS